MFNWHMALGAKARTQRRTPFPLPTALIPVHMVISFPKKKDTTEQEGDSHET